MEEGVYCANGLLNEIAEFLEKDNVANITLVENLTNAAQDRGWKSGP